MTGTKNRCAACARATPALIYPLLLCGARNRLVEPAFGCILFREKKK